jgi:ribose transport system permease protein
MREDETSPAPALEQPHSTSLTGVESEPGGASGEPPPLPGRGEPRAVKSTPWRNIGNRYGVVIVLLAIPVFFSIYRPAAYFTTGNFQTILSTQAVLVFLTLGLTAPLVADEFDLSIGAQLGFSATLLAVLTVNDHVPLGLAILACLGSGLVLGAVNSAVVVKMGVNSFITTLGTGTVLLGLTLEISGSTIISGVPTALVSAVSGTHILGLSLSVYYAFALAAVLWYVYEHTPLGRYMYFTGFGREAARLSGVRVDSIRIGALVFSAVIATVAGILEVGSLGGADPTAGNNFLLPAFAGAFLGATTIKVGRFNAWGSLIAVYLLQSGITGLEIVGLSGWVDQVFNGVALVLAVMFATFAARKAVART